MSTSPKGVPTVIERKGIDFEVYDDDGWIQWPDGTDIPLHETKTGVKCSVQGCQCCFDTASQWESHLMRSHGMRKKVPIECEGCGETFRVQANEADRRKHCSVECRYPGIHAYCMTCGDRFRTTAYRMREGKRYCSVACANRMTNQIKE